MEHSSALGTYAGYGLIVLFLLILIAALLRSLMFPLVLVALQFAQKLGRPSAKGVEEEPADNRKLGTSNFKRRVR